MKERKIYMVKKGGKNKASYAEAGVRATCIAPPPTLGQFFVKKGGVVVY
jgi:hypothetical protein